MKQKGFAPIIIIIVILTLLVSGIVYYLRRQHTCILGGYIKDQLRNNNNTVIAETPSLGCTISLTQCAEGYCSSPAESIKCGKSGSACGKEIYCFCP